MRARRSRRRTCVSPPRRRCCRCPYGEPRNFRRALSRATVLQYHYALTMIVQLFPTCLVNEIRPDAGMAVARVLERIGCEVVLPEGLTCCGQPAYNAGFHDEARQVARHAIEVLAATDGPIVVPSGSCCDMLVHQNVELFRDDPAVAAAAQRVSSRCREFSQFVAE